MDTQTYDAVVLGGGPAGLQAALSIGRMHRSVLVLDSGRYRNDPAAHMHNVLGHDGQPPAAFRAQARADLAGYDTVEVRAARVTAVAPDDSGFRVNVADGAEVRGRRVLIATGLRDTLPDVPGLAELWGDVVAHCPFCHGHELTGSPVGILAATPHAAVLAGMLAPIASSLTVLTDGAAPDPVVATQLASLGATVVTSRVVGVRESSPGARVELVTGDAVDVAGLFVAPVLSQAAPFAEQLGLDLLPSGCVSVDDLGRTSRPGVYAAGDAAHRPSLPMPMAAVLSAAAAGQVAGSAIVHDQVSEELPTPPPSPPAGPGSGATV
ncbi:NAD(P)/FAD-dependent oxidoreductase [Nocardioides mesophilus]|uniref:NAD(P)/FAD-dependent oxidoreductase n=1 Tax=Nocardioides mesophilus TaxID=433659 RepID=A0A7G9RFZ2_9ACTN|nr:NAD(P)/FAD-dependent oxidoreductase [Nocardioides mesophilus]QNN54517.1 NAD(P)/FAD-dependent oxidoreductase [Nocardioides mesophilus]